MDNIEIELRGSLPIDMEKGAILQKISQIWGVFEYTKELVIFFRYENDFRFKFIHSNGEFVLKKRLEDQTSQLEWVTKIHKSDIRNFLIQLSFLGYKEGLLSTGERYAFKKNGVEFCLKFNTPIGDFFEIEKIVNSKKLIEFTKNELNLILEQYSLKSWNDNEYSEIRRKSLESLRRISLLDENSFKLNEEIEAFIFG